MPLVPNVLPALRRAIRLAASGTLWLLAGALWAPATAQVGTPSAAAAADSSHCALFWQVTAQLDMAPGGAPSLLVQLRFPAGGRNQTRLHLPGGWTDHTALPGPAGQTAVPLADEPAWRTVTHAPGGTVQLQWLVQPNGDASRGGHAQLTPVWFAFSGQGVLPVPDTADATPVGTACIALDGLDKQARWATSHGSAEGAAAQFVLEPSPLPLAQRVQQALYAGGALQTQAAPGVTAVLPAISPWPFDSTAVAQAGARALAAQLRQWPGPAAHAHPPHWLLLVLPAARAAAGLTTLASAWHHALALQLPPDWPGNDAALEVAFTQALTRAWTTGRFGPLAHAGRGDAALRIWFSEGWADFLAHRSLLREGLWTADDYAAAVNARIAADLAEPARALPNTQLARASMQAPQLASLQARRGEWLALRWHQALRQAGHPGLEAVLRRQMVPADQARRDGPISAPLATHRVVAALRTVLNDQPMRDLQRHIDQGQPFDFDANSLGPCFTLAATRPGTAPEYKPVDAALQQPACQGWLGTGPMADATALPRPAGGTAVRGRDAKAQARALAKPGSRVAKPATKATSKAGKQNARPGAKPTAKPGAKPAAKRPASAKTPKAGQRAA